MDFNLPEETQALQDVCRKFAAQEIRPYAAEWSRTHTFPCDVFQRMGELGLTGMLVPSEYGGSASGVVNYVTALEQIGLADQSVAAALNAHSTIATLPLLRFGNEEQKHKWLTPLASGQHIGAFGLTEPGAGSDAAGIATRAERVSDGWVINGTKMFISNPGTPISLGVTILAATGSGDRGRQFGTFFIPDNSPGYSKSPPLDKLGWNAMDTRELVFTDCWVSDAHLIGEEGRGLTQMLSVLDEGRISVATLGLSLSQRALELALEHAAHRVQFGRPLIEFQAISHKVADMATQIEAARWLVYRAASLADEGKEFSKEAAMAKLFTSEVANQVASESLQIHGGYGYMKESEISRFYADAKILEIGEGTSEIQRNVIARTIARSYRQS